MDVKFSKVLFLSGLFVLVSVSFASDSQVAHADDTRSLINSSALLRATQLNPSPKSKRSRQAHSPREDGLNQGSAADLQIETVDDVINSVEKREQFMTRYRGLLYLKYVNGVSNSGLYEDLEERSLTEKLVVFQIGESFVNALKVSPVAELYRSLVRKVKVYKDYTTVQVNQGDSLKLDMGDRRVPGKSLVEFKLHASARRGLEPRIEIGDSLSITYDLLQKQTLIGCDFEF